MDIGWGVPPEEDIDALLDDEDELEYIREIELQNKQKEVLDIEKLLETNYQSKESKFPELEVKCTRKGIENQNETFSTNPSKDVQPPELKRSKRSSSVCNDIDIDLSSAPKIQRLPMREISNVEDDVGNLRTNNDIDLSMSNYRIPRMGERKFYKRIPKGTDFQAVTMPDGQRFYMRLFDSENQNVQKPNKLPRFDEGLCGVPYRALRKQALNVQISLNQSDVDNSALLQSNDSLTVDAKDSKILHDSNNNESLLWVEKFRPKNFLELLSDDGTNRTLLRWLKLWDKIVFNKEIKLKKSQSDQNEPNNTNEQIAKASPTEILFEFDALNRPKQKCALLYGPPGLGKTTLAHIIGATAGYNVVEMNASDDRSLEKFQEKLIAATQMKSVLNQQGDQRPNCLIIDEIDGSIAPVVSFLVDLITGKEKQATKANKKGKRDIVLQRPIICICNDLYVPALRPLRQQALLVPFPPTLSSRLAQRLQDIALKEKLRTDMTALMALTEKTENDIRACLSTLQFFKSRGKYMRSVDIHKVNIGQKDAHKSLRTIWEDMFQIPRSSSKRKFVAQTNGIGENDEFVQEESLSSMSNRYKTMLKSVQSCGDYEKMMQGAYENYLTIKFKDIKMKNVLSGNDWLQFFDMMQQQIQHSQNYSTMGYLPYTFVAFHLLYAASGPKPKLNWPSVQYEMTNKLQKSQNLLKSMIAEMLPAARIFSSPQTLVCDILPCLLRIIQSNIRPVNTQLYSAKEKQELKHLVDILIAYNLTYVQEMSPEGQYSYRLDPELEEVVYFPNINHASLPYSIKQLIAHEVEVEKMRRDTPIDTGRGISKPEGPKSKAKKETDKLPSDVVPNHMQKLKAKDIHVKERIPVDFFGRKIEKSTNADKGNIAGKEGKKGELVFSDVWFNFKEGFNNAVRRTIRMKDLI